MKAALSALLAATLGVAGGAQGTSPPQEPSTSSRCPSAATAFRSGQFERAAAAARQCLEWGVDDSETYKLLAFSFYILQRHDDYRTSLEQAMAVHPRDASLNYHLGRFLYEKKQYRSALDHFLSAIQKDPEDFKALYYSGIIKQGTGDLDGAVQDYRGAIAAIEKKRAGYGWPFAALGELLGLQGQVDEGLSWSYRSTRNDPQLPYAYYVYAKALMRKDADFEVEHALQRALQLDPDYPEAYFLLGRYYTKIGEKEKARSAFSRFEELKRNPQPSPYGIRR